MPDNAPNIAASGYAASVVAVDDSATKEIIANYATCTNVPFNIFTTTTHSYHARVVAIGDVPFIKPDHAADTASPRTGFVIFIVEAAYIASIVAVGDNAFSIITDHAADIGKTYNIGLRST